MIKSSALTPSHLISFIMQEPIEPLLIPDILPRPRDLSFLVHNRVFVLVVVTGVATWIGLVTSKNPEQLISGGGYILLLFLLFVTSKHPDKVRVNDYFIFILLIF